jgi:hypothetical protein
MKWLLGLVAAVVLGGAIFALSRTPLHQQPTAKGFDAFLAKATTVARAESQALAKCYHPDDSTATAANISFLSKDVRKTESLSRPVVATADLYMTISPAPKGSGDKGFVLFACTFEHDGTTWRLGTGMKPLWVDIPLETQERVWGWLLRVAGKADR